MLFAISGAISAIVLRVNPVFTAVAMADNRFGILNKTWAPWALRVILAVLVLDFVKYAVHRACHSLPWLWRVHQVHHSDPDLDVSTATRAHPVEVLLNHGVTLGAVALLAPPPVAVLAAELLACFQSFFEHANASLPAWFEKPLRRWIVTPDMHPIHHSNQVWEQSRNLGEIFPWWDKLLGTYSADPLGGEDGWVPGLAGLDGQSTVGLGFMLTEPLQTPRPRT